MTLDLRAIRVLVDKLHENPWDAESAVVLADWCENVGLDGAAASMRLPENRIEFNQAVAALKVLFCADARGLGSPRYDRVMSFRRAGANTPRGMHFLEAGESMVMTCSCPTKMVARKILVPSSCGGHAVLDRMNVGGRAVLEGPIDVECFTIDAPDLLNVRLAEGSMVDIVLTSISMTDLLITASLVGLSSELAGKRP